MSRSIIAAIADLMFVCVVCVWAYRLQVCPALSLRPLPAFMFCFVCVWASARAAGWEMSRPIIAAVADFMLVCVVCVWAYRLQVCPALSLRPLPAFMLCFVCISLCVFEPARVQLGVCPALSLRPLPTLCYVLFVFFWFVFGPAHVQLGV